LILLLIQLESWEAAIKSGFAPSDNGKPPQPLAIAKLLGWIQFHSRDKTAQLNLTARACHAAYAAIWRPRITDAIEIMIGQQREFCQWWTEIVSPGESPGTNQWSVSDLLPTTTAFKAEQETGISKKQVSRWKSALADEDAYRWAITQAACRKSRHRASREPSRRGEHLDPRDLGDQFSVPLLCDGPHSATTGRILAPFDRQRWPSGLQSVRYRLT
jgi:hypothetical protein